jgi:pentatricopeptide repeat protein
MYAKSGIMQDPWRVFNKMPSQGVVTSTTMILGHVQCRQGQMALELFQQMQQEGVQSDSVTFVGFLNACSSVAAFEEGSCVHQQIIQSGLELDAFVGNSLVDMHAKCGSIEDTSKVFHKMPSQDVVTWNGHGKEASSHILNGCVKKVSSQMISLLLVFCQHVAMQVW